MTAETMTDDLVSRKDSLIVRLTDENYNQIVSALLCRRDEIDAKLLDAAKKHDPWLGMSPAAGLMATRKAIDAALVAVRAWL